MNKQRVAIGVVGLMLLSASEITAAQVTASMSGRIQAPACRAVVPSQIVPLGRYFKTDFTAIGKRVGITDFTVRLSCDRAPGTLGITLEAAQPDPVIAGALGLSPGSTAAGMIIQIMDSAGTPIVWGSTLQTQAPAAAGTADIALKAAYYQKLAPGQIVAGTANGAATFTIVYR